MQYSYQFDASLAQLMALFSDPQFIVDRAVALGALEASAEIETGEKELRVELYQRREAKVPGFMKGRVASVQDVDIIETWSWTERRAEALSVTRVRAVPMEIEGQIVLAELDDGRCRFEFDYSVKVDLPLIGKRVADYAQRKILKELEAEANYTQAVLDR